jgi:phosphatidylglycerol lysyltransferase
VWEIKGRPFLHYLGTIVSFVIFCLALWVVHKALAEFHLDDLILRYHQLSATSLLSALGFTAASYFLLTGYDLLALRYLGHSLPYPKVASASFISYAFTQNLGLSLITGGPVRYRMYGAAGLSNIEIATVAFLCAFTFGLGATLLGGAALVFEPPQALAALGLSPTLMAVVGWLLIALVASYVAATFRFKEPIKIGQWQMRLPSPTVTLQQLVLAGFDLAAAAGAFYMLLQLPGLGTFGDLTFLHFLGIFLLATAAGVLSHVPGGLGVFESAMILLLPNLPADAVLSASLAYRVIYYLLPLFLALFMLLGAEMLRHRKNIGRWTLRIGGWIPRLYPLVFGSAAFLGGVMLLLSGVTPELASRLSVMRQIVPLPLLEASHLMGSLSGLGLLILSGGLFRRLDSAYVLTIALLAAGILFSLLKGFDYEEASILGIILVLLIPSRSAFYRKASLWSERLSLGWMVAIAIVLLGTTWLGFFSYKHVEYSNELWWKFAFSRNTPRFLRASLIVTVIAMALALRKLMMPTPPAGHLPTQEDIGRIKEILSHYPDTTGNLALTRDKRLLFSDSGRSFIMYGVKGRSWIALGDPIGPEEELADLAWKFRDECDRFDGLPAVYLADAAMLPLYLDMGLTPLKLGEEARVPLENFSLEGPERRDLRYAHRKMGKEAIVCEIATIDQIESFIPEIKAVSDAWLNGKNTQEKGFSIGFFDVEYLKNFRHALVRRDGKLIAFATLWESADKQEMSVDLMRFTPDAPNGVMDYIFAELMLQARAEGFQWFNLGMAPLSGLEEHALAPLWHRAGTFVFRQGEHFYNFEGLRNYKEKFNPVWLPKYLCCRGGLAIPRVLIDVAAIISGGLKGIIAK